MIKNNIKANIMYRVFNPTRPNEILSLDVAEIKLQNNTKTYLSLYVNTYTGELIGVSISNKQDYQHTRKTLEAIIRRKNRYNKEGITRKR